MKRNVKIKTRPEEKIKTKNITITEKTKVLNAKVKNEDKKDEEKNDSAVSFAVGNIENKAYALSSALLKTANKIGEKNFIKTLEKTESRKESEDSVKDKIKKDYGKEQYVEKEKTNNNCQTNSKINKMPYENFSYSRENDFRSENEYKVKHIQNKSQYESRVRRKKEIKFENRIRVRSISENIHFKFMQDSNTERSTLKYVQMDSITNSLPYSDNKKLYQIGYLNSLQKAAENTENTVKKIAHSGKKIFKIIKNTAAKAYKAVSSIASAIIAGGWTAAITIILICIIAAVLTSFYGIFFSNDTGSVTAHSVILEINDDYDNAVNEIKSKDSYDKIEINGNRTSWKDILAIYAVKMTTTKDINSVADFTDENIKALKKIFWDMNKLTSSVKTYYDTEEITYVDENGNIVNEVTEKKIKILTITVNGKTANEMAKSYSFDAIQKDFLNELTDPVNDSLWSALIYNTGLNGSVDISDLTFENENANEIQKQLVYVAVNSASFGISSKSGYCQAWVADIYEALTSSRGSAHCALCAADKYSVSNDFSKIKVGATVYGYASNPYGHVGIYIGNGMVIHNLNGTVKTQTLSSWIEQFKGFSWGWENSQNLSELS